MYVFGEPSSFVYRDGLETRVSGRKRFADSTRGPAHVSRRRYDFSVSEKMSSARARTATVVTEPRRPGETQTGGGGGSPAMAPTGLDRRGAPARARDLQQTAFFTCPLSPSSAVSHSLTLSLSLSLTLSLCLCLSTRLSGRRRIRSNPWRFETERRAGQLKRRRSTSFSGRGRQG